MNRPALSKLVTRFGVGEEEKEKADRGKRERRERERKKLSREDLIDKIKKITDDQHFCWICYTISWSSANFVIQIYIFQILLNPYYNRITHLFFLSSFFMKFNLFMIRFGRYFLENEEDVKISSKEFQKFRKRKILWKRTLPACLHLP